MTPGQALGMLLVGVIALSIGAGIAFFIILRKVYKETYVKDKNKYVFRKLGTI